ncbi:FKBP-type peptidyl-prolyl cis-trans isomerase [Runella zeae]|uniref:FKBP-type peptidyl-prolyl cis-trans isomerase n=1 Tax=Runella zeae TaxID=94255 RepID=UPI00042725F8|nr:FKBP-type peptidyl-prolyl cis-trans isomerase [Runella zeae]
MKIAPNQVVAVTYELSLLNDSDEWQMVETVGDDQPMYFIQGMSGLPEAFEEQLNGLSEGDTFDFKLDAEQGYGDYDTESVAEIPLEVFKVDGELQADILQVGNMVPMTNEEGHRLMGQIVEIDEEFVLMDFNHPLAGREMHFVGTVVKVRPATAEELDHGHVHGDGGVHPH